ncbi:hypothetical protein I6A84_25235 [Frankia sp. CNm7]|uniref:Uncharacterized protein n=1 Tax=Frankia nepalensis TaxID=1836974 RepID=A0A937RUT4_9ACTN|nr:hypothetical protein [Frankia nepalensis]MBL7502142.1 hypothetical protein [Frankia nepalensis]MBL7514368.1 hypothetical protein [Frankia nepalensis]MBL7521302.1 hypothetical protein [Frankia nepalensis]MBL7633714.1 hypothetical protein [Frankia nepalensis]
MVRVIAVAVAVVTLVLAAWVFFLAWRNRPIGRAVLAAAGVAEALLLAQVVGAIVLVAQGERAAEPLTFTLYLVASLVALPIGAWWALGERSRSATAVLGVAALVVAILVERLAQTWS